MSLTGVRGVTAVHRIQTIVDTNPRADEAIQVLLGRHWRPRLVALVAMAVLPDPGKCIEPLWASLRSEFAGNVHSIVAVARLLDPNFVPRSRVELEWLQPRCEKLMEQSRRLLQKLPEVDTEARSLPIWGDHGFMIAKSLLAYLRELPQPPNWFEEVNQWWDVPYFREEAAFTNWRDRLLYCIEPGKFAPLVSK